jgi:CRP/FNR family transcriptional regulator, cyclic AMP receptor protein
MPSASAHTAGAEGNYVAMPTTNLFDHAADAKPVAAGTTLFHAGDARDGLYAVVEGEVDIIVNGKVVETVGKGGIFGEMALIEQEDRVATAVVKTDAKIVVVDERRFLFLVQQTPNFSLHVMRVLSDRLRRMDDRFVRPTRA